MQPIPASHVHTRSIILALCLYNIAGSALAIVLPPSNDQCSGAVEIPGAGPFPATTPPRVLNGATTIGDPPFPPPETSFDTNITHSVWYKFTPASSGLYTISSAYDTATTPTFRDTTMVLYTASGDCTGLNIHAYNEDSGTLRAAISTNLVAGQLYYVVVWVGRTEILTPGIELELRITKPALPPNDNCATPMVIPSTITAPIVTAVVDTTLAGTAPRAPLTCVTNTGAMPSREIWYQFTPAVGGTYIFSTGADTLTRIEDTAIALYTLGGGNCANQNQIACNDNSFGRAVLSWPLTAGTTYHLAVYDNATNYIPGETDLQLRIAPATAPTIVTLPPTSISSTGVMLHGTINANGLLSRFWFEWGPTATLGTTSAVRVLFATAATIHTNIVVSGFVPGVTYSYRMIGTNQLGRGQGALQTFTYTPTPPEIIAYEYESSGAFNVEFEGAASHLYLVQASTNLVDWADVGVATNASPTIYTYRHTTPDRQRYYRVKQP